MNQSRYGLKARLAVGVIIVTGLLLVIIITLATHAGLASANSTDLANAEGAFPAMVGSRIDTCTLCHTSLAAIPALNPFGTAYKNAGRNPAALAAIANLDSDGDGFTNAQEIAAFTFPGDPNDHPAAAATNTVPAPTNTQPAPTNTLPAGPTATQPAGPTATNTKIPIMTLTPGPTQTLGSGKPTKTKRPTEVEPTEKAKSPEPTEIGKSPEPTENEGEHHQAKTPQSTQEFHATRTPGPTQVCNTPTPGQKSDEGHKNPCGGGGDHNKDGGAPKASGDNFLAGLWSNVTTYISHLRI